MELAKLTRTAIMTKAEDMEEEVPVEGISAAGFVETIVAEADTCTI